MKMKEILNQKLAFDTKWVRENPESAADMLEILIHERELDRDYIKVLEIRNEIMREANLLLKAIIENYKNKNIDNE